MSSYKSFAVAGAGTIGGPIVTSLLEKGVSVLILSRTARSAPAGATVATVDYNDVPALTATLKEHAVDVVISTLGFEGLPLQNALGDAAKAAGVQLFVPSEFGAPTEGAPAELFQKKLAVVRHLTAIGLPYARIYTGFFTRIVPWIVGIGETGSAHIIGSGNVPFSTTAEADIAGFVTHIVTALPPSELANRTFRVEGDRATLREVATLFGKPVVQHDAPPKELSSLQGFFLELVEQGGASTGYDYAAQKDLGSAGEANALWPGHHWTTIKEFHKL